MYAMTAAHPTLPIPSYARIRNPANGREVLVRVNDRGPFVAGRIVDLSYAAAFKLDLLRGVAPVELERITFDEIRTGAWRGGGGVRVAAAGAATAPAGVPGGRGRRRAGASTSPAQDVRHRPPAAVEVPAQDVAFAVGAGSPRRSPSPAPRRSPPLRHRRADARPARPRARRSGARLLGPARRVSRARRRRDLPPPRRRRRRVVVARAAAGDLRRRVALSRAGRARIRVATSRGRSARARAASCRSSSSGDERPIVSDRPSSARASASTREAAAARAAPRQTILFTGHMVDAPDRAGAALSGDARRRRRASHRRPRSTRSAPGPDDLALTQGAAGGDLLFAEACLARAVPLRLLLPLARARVRRGVAAAGRRRRRLARALSRRRRPARRAAARSAARARSAGAGRRRLRSRQPLAARERARLRRRQAVLHLPVGRRRRRRAGRHAPSRRGRARGAAAASFASTRARSERVSRRPHSEGCGGRRRDASIAARRQRLPRSTARNDDAAPSAAQTATTHSGADTTWRRRQRRPRARTRAAAKGKAMGLSLHIGLNSVSARRLRRLDRPARRLRSSTPTT